MTEEQPIKTGTALFLDDMAQAVNRADAVIAQLIHQLAPTFQQIGNLLNERYKEAGFPYGDSHEGLMQWIKAIGEDYNRRHEAERIQTHLEVLEYARQIGEKMGLS